jgi:hypothetical protein
MDESKEPPSYFNGGGGPRSQLPQMTYMNQQSPYTGQQPLPGIGYQQTTTRMNQRRVVPAQSHLSGQPSMMPMNANTGVGQQPIQPQTATGMMPGTMLVPQCNIYYLFLSEGC